MKRREFVALLGGAACAWPLESRAQQPKMPVIGYLGSESKVLFARRIDAFFNGLATTGFRVNHNVAVEYRWAEGKNERLAALAADLVRIQVSVIAAPGSVVSALAAKAATGTIPIVFEIGADPVAAGLVASLSRPGANVTGVTSLNTEVGPKRLELLHELIPSATVFALLVNPANPKNAEDTTRGLERAAGARGVQVQVLQASAERDFEPAFEKAGALKAKGLVIANDPVFGTRSELMAALALRHKLPAVHQSREFAAAGGLMSFGGSIAESHGQAGRYVGRILQGERPANLPVYQATKFELAVNLKAAAALGLTVPGSLLARADEVIE